MQREYVETRLAYEAELERRGVDERRREELLTVLEAQHCRRIETYERWFRAGLQRGVPVP